MFRDRWQIERTRFDLDDRGSGMARYGICISGQFFEFVVLANAPVEGGRSGRVLDGERDMNAGLYEGVASDEQIETMRREMPKIYGGRSQNGTLIWCRSNRSMRIFDHVVDRLADGCQPDPHEVAEIGYIMRNVGIEGNGIYGTRAFADYGAGHPLAYPYMAQMLAGYMMREFSFDLVEHLAAMRSPHAARLARDFKSYIGIGNGSAIGLVFFTQHRPRFIGRWLEMRERLLAAAAALELQPQDERYGFFLRLIERAARFCDEDLVENPIGPRTKSAIAVQLRDVARHAGTLRGKILLGDIIAAAESLCSAPAAEMVMSCAMELLPQLRDELLECFLVDEELAVSPTLSLAEVDALLRRDYAWALAMDTESAAANHYVWYQSVSNDEPRRGTSADTDASANMLRNIPAMAKALADDIRAFGTDRILAEFLLRHPRHRYLIQRVERLRDTGFHTPHANLFARDFKALDLVKLVMVGFYGVEKPVDFLDRNSRGIMFHGAPSRDRIGETLEPGWFYPLMPVAAR
jgi:hypothetical protein